MSHVSCIPKPSMLMLWFRPTDWKHVEDELYTQLGDNFHIHGSILSSGHTILFKYWIKWDNFRSHVYELNSSNILEETHS
jgi:hypothetical protein